MESPNIQSEKKVQALWLMQSLSLVFRQEHREPIIDAALCDVDSKLDGALSNRG